VTDRDRPCGKKMYTSSTSTLAAPSLQQRQSSRGGVGGGIGMGGVSQGVSNQRFSPKSFRYNGRVASVLLPCLVVLVGYGGPLVAGVLIVRSFWLII